MKPAESKLIDWAWDDKIKLVKNSRDLHVYTESQVKKTMKKISNLVVMFFGEKELVRKKV